LGKTPNLLATTIECGGDPGQAPSIPICRRKLAMVYKFDPTHSTATIFDLDDSTRMMEKGWMEFVRENKPIPVSYFPKSLTIERASASLPDLFHTSRGIIVVSERARAILDRLAPGEVGFIPVTIRAAPDNMAQSVARCPLFRSRFRPYDHGDIGSPDSVLSGWS